MEFSGSEQVKGFKKESGNILHGKYPSSVFLFDAVGRKTMANSAVLSRLASAFLDRKAFATGMTALKLVETFILQVDPSVCSLPAIAAGLRSLERCLIDTGLMRANKTTLLLGSALYFLVAARHIASTSPGIFWRACRPCAVYPVSGAPPQHGSHQWLPRTLLRRALAP
eukprot:Skav209390  [mRNA]  locus=scaffold3334:221240:221746:- [translate_table: standard]